jgi:MFS family permease
MSVHRLRQLIVATALSNVADGVFQIVLPLAALGITRDPGAFAGVTFVGRLPWLLFALPAGALADRLDRRRTMMLVDIARAATIAILAATFAVGVEALWILYVVAFALGVGETLFDTAAQSILPAIVLDPDQLSKANGRLSAVELTTNQFIGPPLGAVMAGVSVVGALLFSSVAYLFASASLLALVGGQFRTKRIGPRTKIRTDICQGVSYLVRHRLLRSLAVCVGISNLASTATFAVFPLYAIAPGPMGLSEAGFGVLITTVAAGSVAGSFLVQRLEHRLGTRRVLILTSATFPVFSLAPALTNSVLWIAASFFAGGFLVVGWNVITVSLRQRIVPDHLLGRVNAGYRLVAWGTIPIGAALGGLIGQQVSLTATFWTAAAISAICLPIVLLSATKHELDTAQVDTNTANDL